jgi:hypothetical protein
MPRAVASTQIGAGDAFGLNHAVKLVVSRSRKPK